MRRVFTKVVSLALVGTAAFAGAALARLHLQNAHRLFDAPDGSKQEPLRATPIAGMLEAMRGTEVAYVSKDGRYAIRGDLFDLQTQEDLTEQRRRAVRAQIMRSVPDDETIAFGPATARHTVTVFTDLDCTFCRRLHSQIAEYNRLGIRIRYLFFPRSGPNSDSWRKAEQVWCSSDRHDALTRAKQDLAIEVRACRSALVQRDYELATRLNVQATPTLIFDNGELLAGYRPPAALALELSKAER